MNNFTRQERLRLKKDIEKLFNKGESKSFSAFPIRGIFRFFENESTEEHKKTSVRILISVSKRRLKHAVERNRAKRQIREGYRLNKDILISQLKDKNVDLAFVWIDDKPYDSKNVHQSIQRILQRVSEKC